VWLKEKKKTIAEMLKTSVFLKVRSLDDKARRGIRTRQPLFAVTFASENRKKNKKSEITLLLSALATLWKVLRIQRFQKEINMGTS
jgi:hypothetical protein